MNKRQRKKRDKKILVVSKVCHGTGTVTFSNLHDYTVTNGVVTIHKTGWYQFGPMLDPRITVGKPIHIPAGRHKEFYWKIKE